jgi:hypothetical protein
MELKNYTTQKILDAMLLDAKIPKEQKDAEQLKAIISDDAFALCDFINILVDKIEHARLSL